MFIKKNKTCHEGKFNLEFYSFLFSKNYITARVICRSEFKNGSPRTIFMKILTTSNNTFSTFSPRDLYNRILILFCFDSVLVGVIFLVCCLSTTCHLIIMTRISNGKKTSKYFNVFNFLLLCHRLYF